MRINLEVPYEEKEEAKSKGAIWDMARKTWYIIDLPELKPFQKWIPELKGWQCTETKTY